MIIAVDWDVKHLFKQTKHYSGRIEHGGISDSDSY